MDSRGEQAGHSQDSGNLRPATGLRGKQNNAHCDNTETRGSQCAAPVGCSRA